MSLIKTAKSGLIRTVAAFERLRVQPPSSDSLHKIKNFLLLQYTIPLGTTIHATPLVRALRKAVPDCRIAVAANGFACDIFRNFPGIDYLIETKNPLVDLKQAVQVLRNRNPFRGTDYAILTSVGNERTRIVAQAMLLGTAPRIGFTVAPHLYRIPLLFDHSRSQISNNLRIVEALGHPVQHFEPQIFFSSADQLQVRELLDTNGVPHSQPIAIFITQTSITQRKSWRRERFQQAARFLVERHGAHIVFVGTADEAPAIEQLRSGLPFPTTTVAGKTNILQMAALMSIATIGLTLDTGPMHIGRAVGLPMVIIAPAWSPAVKWLPLNDPRFRILKNADLTVAPSDYLIDEVSVDEVTAALDQLLTLWPHRPSSY